MFIRGKGGESGSLCLSLQIPGAMAHHSPSQRLTLPIQDTKADPGLMHQENKGQWINV